MAALILSGPGESSGIDSPSATIGLPPSSPESPLASSPMPQALISLFRTSPASVISVEAGADLTTIQREATRNGLYMRVLAVQPSEVPGGTRNVKQLIIGRDYQAVQEMWESTRHHGSPKSSLSLPLAVGAAMGAVSVLAALAFS